MKLGNKNSEAKERFSYIKWCEKNSKQFLTIFIIIVMTVIATYVVNVVMYWNTVTSIGDGAYKYSSDTYADIKNAMYNCVLESGGIDEKGLRAYVDHYDIDYGSNGENTHLKCNKEDGYFVAEVKVVFDTNYEVIEDETKMNFNSQNEYMRSYWIDMAVRMFGGGAGICLCFVLFFFIGAFAIYKLLKKRALKKERRTKEPSETFGPLNPNEEDAS